MNFDLTVSADTASGNILYDVTYTYLVDGSVKMDEHYTVSKNIGNYDCGMSFGL